MTSYRLFGVHDWAARLVSCGAGFLCVFVTYAWARRTAGARAALAGALILVLSGRFVHHGRLLTMNGLLCLWVTLALAAAHLAVSGASLRRRWWLLSALSCGLGLLSKGPVALALVVPPVLALTFLDARAARVRVRDWLIYGAVSSGLAAPWFVAVALRDPSFLDYYFWKHHVERYLAPFDHAGPCWYYLPDLLLGMFPWTLLLPALTKSLSAHAGPVSPRPRALGFFLLSFLWVFIFFSASGCKRPGYILPAMPLLALALGCFLDTLLPADGLLSAGRMLLAQPSRLASVATILMLITGFGTSVAAGQTGALSGGWAWAAAGVCALGLLGLALARARPLPWAACAGVTFALLLGALVGLLPGYARKYSLRAHLDTEGVGGHAAGAPVFCYPHRWDSVHFYLRRDDVGVYAPDQFGRLLAELQRHPCSLLFVKTGAALHQLRAGLPPALEFIPGNDRHMVTVGWVRRRSE